MHQLFETFFQLDINLKPTHSGKCNLDTNKVQQYLNRLQHIDLNLATSVEKVLFQRTTYIDHDHFLHLLNQGLDSFLAEHGTETPFDIVLTGDGQRYSSEEYVVQLLWPKLRNLKNLNQIRYFETENPNPIAKTILWIDDGSYSGGNLMNMLEYAQKESAQKVHIILAAICKTVNDNFVKPSQDFISLHCSLEVGRIEDEIISRYFWTCYLAPSLYFDHKIASCNSTCKSVLEYGLVPDRPLTDEEYESDECYTPGVRMGHLTMNPPSRNIIEHLEHVHKNLAK
jgi:hypothetical protein